ncbi:Endonuclease/exonuclease/phosphatase [Russula aff. rugulosa BPL654]|nr:Endonuclease/exonuclease/phosphatase [Russula aff. rugulosa BPL654]
MDHINKWTLINSTIRTEKIAILALQETHLDEERLNDIKNCFSKNFDIYSSSDPENPRGSAGVAYIINKAIIAPTSVRTNVLKQGQAIMLRIMSPPYINEVTLINIYTPNNARDQPTFWEEIDRERREKHLSKPDFLLGDFNIKEDLIDRSPPTLNNHQAIEVLRETRHSWGVQDQWRHDNPNGRIFTFKQIREGTYRYARLDRIYTATRHVCHLFEWRANPPTIPTDHWMVSVKFAPKDALLVRNGRWTWPLNSINNETLINRIVKEEKAANTPADQRHDNPQILWKTFKTNITTLAKKELKNEKHKIHTKIHVTNFVRPPRT